MTDIEIPPIDIGELYDMLENHDWLWESKTDDEYRSGAQWWRRIQQASQQSKAHRDLVDRYQQSVVWNLAKPRRPEKP